MKQVIHLIPFDGPGGVETAALSMRKISTPEFEFEVRVLFPGTLTAWLRHKSINPLSYLFATAKLVTHPPQVLIVSLWRAAIVGVLCKLLRPRVKLVVFLHCGRRVHLIDSLVTSIAIDLATEIWSDSAASIVATAPTALQRNSRVISYIPRRFLPVTNLEPSPTFIFWGRLAKQKNLRRAICLFAMVHKKVPGARFTIIGPDGGDAASLRRLCNELCIDASVSFVGAKGQDELVTFACAASFFLFTSEFEGMGLAVVEAMQMGLVPVVTKAGEVGEFCQHNINSLVIESDQTTVEAILKVCGEPDEFIRLRDGAIKTWIGKPSYGDEVRAGCEQILAGSIKRNL